MTSRLRFIFLCTKHNTNRVTNIIFQNVSKNSKSFHCSSVNTLSNVNLKSSYLLNNATFDKRGCPETNDVMKRNENVESNSNLIKIHDKSQESYNIELIENNDSELSEALEDVDEKLPGPFDRCDEDLSDIGPNITPTFNFAKFANESNTIQQLVKLGVELYKLESNREVVEMFLSLDFDRDMKPYIQFLHDCGVKPENLGYFITKYPEIFKEDMAHLHTRIRYLRAHDFSIELIQRIVNTCPRWLSFNTKEIDARLGYFQDQFKLSGFETRHLATISPKLITHDMKRVTVTTFSLKEEMGFNDSERKYILLTTPSIWTINKSRVLATFDYVHNHMGLSHYTISRHSIILMYRKWKVEERHQFLVELKRNQYDPTKPLYVPPKELIRGSDLEFCNKYAKASIDTYNNFLKIMQYIKQI